MALIGIMNIKSCCKRSVFSAIGLLALTFHTAAQAQADKHSVPIKTEDHVGRTEKAAASEADLAKQLQNPVSDLISVPMENRVDLGPGSTARYTLNIMPVIPIDLSKDWLLVSRTILPINISQKPVGGDPLLDEVGVSPVRKGPTIGGLGDITQSFFLVPRESVNGWTWGAGPVFRLPTATQSSFGAGKWGAGPTAVALRQNGPWTYGMLANHIWSFAGWGKESVNTTFLQPFLAYTTASNTTFGLGSETGYSWSQKQWVVPIDANVSQLFEVGKMPISVGLGGRVYAERPRGGPNWGLTLTVTLVFPTK